MVKPLQEDPLQENPLQDKRQGDANRTMGTPKKAKTLAESPLSSYGDNTGKLAVSSSAPDASAVRSAQQRQFANQLGGVSMSNAAAVHQGRKDAQAIIGRASQPKSPAQTTAAGAYSPLAGDAAHFQAMASRESSARAQKDAEGRAKFDAWVERRDADDNNNGIPDRDEAVASKFGSVGLNNMRELSRMNAKYSTYLKGYHADEEARATSRAMSFDEFAKAEQEAYKKRPVYGMSNGESSPSDRNVADTGQVDPLQAARASAIAAREREREERMNSPGMKMRQAQAQERSILNGAMVQARSMGYPPQAAMQYAQASLQNYLRQNAVGSERDWKSAESRADREVDFDKAKLTSETTKHGADALKDVGLANSAATVTVSSNKLEGDKYSSDNTLAGQELNYKTQQNISDGNNRTRLEISKLEAGLQREIAAERARLDRELAIIDSDKELKLEDRRFKIEQARLASSERIKGLEVELQREQVDSNELLGLAGIESQNRGIDAQRDVGMAGVGAEVYKADRNATAQENAAKINAELGLRLKQIDAIVGIDGNRRQFLADQERTKAQVAIANANAEASKQNSLNALTGDLAKTQSNEFLGLAGLQNQAEMNNANIEAQMKQLQAKLEGSALEQAEAQRVMSSLNPEAAGQEARMRAEMNAQQMNPNATLPQIKRAGEAAYQQAYSASAPRWRLMQQNPALQKYVGKPDGESSAASPLSSVPIVPEEGFRRPRNASLSELSEVVGKLTDFYGRSPTRIEVEEALQNRETPLAMPRKLPGPPTFRDPIMSLLGFYGSSEDGARYRDFYRNQ